MFGQTLSNLTLTKPRMQDKYGQREYSACCSHFKLTTLLLSYVYLFGYLSSTTSFCNIKKRSFGTSELTGRYRGETPKLQEIWPENKTTQRLNYCLYMYKYTQYSYKFEMHIKVAVAHQTSRCATS
jgi:hypothetical protein